MFSDRVYLKLNDSNNKKVIQNYLLLIEALIGVAVVVVLSFFLASISALLGQKILRIMKI
jgi:hypothetical protein